MQIAPSQSSTNSITPLAAFSSTDRPNSVAYHGEVREIARIFYMNLLLSVVTLGFYRFWGKTQMRRYLWSHISIFGEPLEYTGTGKELLLGFLKTSVFVAILVAINYAIPEIIDIATPLGIASGLTVAAAFGFLYLAAQFAAQRYRLSRTQWCGIRGGMVGSAWKFAFKAGALFFVSGLLIGLLIPWWRMRCVEWRASASRFGNLEPIIASGRSICFWSFIFGLFILGMINTFSVSFIDWAGHLSENKTTSELLSTIAYLAVLFIVVPLAFAFYYANLQREVLSHLSLGGTGVGSLRFASAITTGGLLWQLFSAIALLVFSIGLAWPLVLHRWVTFTVNNIDIFGHLDVDRLRQESAAAPKASEGLLEALDPGIL